MGVKEWVVSFISYVRQELNKAANLADSFPTLRCFLPPCQATLLWLKEPEIQLLIISRVKGVQDLSVRVYGPSPAYEFPELALRLIEDPVWAGEPVTRGRPPNLRELVTNLLLGF